MDSNGYSDPYVKMYVQTGVHAKLCNFMTPKMVKKLNETLQLSLKSIEQHERNTAKGKRDMVDTNGQD